MKNLLALAMILITSCNSNFTTEKVSSESAELPPGHPTIGDSKEHHPPIVSGEIQVSPSIKEKIAAGATLYVIAKPAAGGPPIAVKKMAVSKFPLSFELLVQDIMMAEGFNMSEEQKFIVTARIDKDGMAGPAQAGDHEGKTTKPISLGTTGVKIQIDKSY